MRQRPRERGEGILIETLTRQSERLIRLALGLGMTGAKAEDVLQDVSVQALKHQQLEFTDREAIAWLIRTTANRCHLEYRKLSRRQRLSREMLRDILPKLNAARPAEEDAIRGEHLDMLNDALTELSETLLVPLNIAILL